MKIIKGKRASKAAKIENLKKAVAARQNARNEPLGMLSRSRVVVCVAFARMLQFTLVCLFRLVIIVSAAVC